MNITLRLVTFLLTRIVPIGLLSRVLVYGITRGFRSMAFSEVSREDYEQPDLPRQRPDPIRPLPLGTQQVEKVNLRDYFEMKLTNLEKQEVMRVEGLAKELAVWQRQSELSISKAESDMTRRLEGMNEFREQLNRQAATFVTKDELLNQRNSLLAEIASVRAAGEARSAAKVSSLDAKIEAHVAAIESKIDALYKVVWTLAGAVAAIQATLAFLT